MKKLNAVSLMLAMVLVLAGIVAVAGAHTDENDTMAAPAIGSIIEDFTIADIDSKEHSLSTLKGKNGTVLIFVSIQCPVVQDYNERMEKLAQDLKEQGVNVIGINANATESPAAIKAHEAQKNLSFPILKDQGNKVADRLGAKVTPEAYFLDANNKLVYHGRIDNSRNVAQINANDLRDAVEATLAGKAVTRTTANAFGCVIKRA
jgi:peroxiredoxin